MTTEVPFRLVGGANPLILTPVRINGTGPHEFVLDTGASTCLLSPELARALEVPVTGSRTGRGAGGPVELAIGTVGTIEVGGVRRHDVQVGITPDLAGIGRAIGARVDGNLGYNLLGDFRLTIDYRAFRLRLESAPAASDTTGGATFDLPPDKPLILLPAHVNGQGPFQFALDTGASAMVVSPQTAARAGLRTDAGRVGGTAGGGGVQYVPTTAGSITVASRTVHDVATIVVDFLESLGGIVGRRLDGIVGFTFLREFRVCIDYPNRTLRLDRNP